MIRSQFIGTSKAKPPKLIGLLIDRIGPVSLFLHFLAFVYAVFVISHFGTEKAKIQENALLAGLVEENWKDTSKLDHFLRDLRRNVGDKKSELSDYIVNALVKMGVEVAKHSFRLTPSSFLTNSSVEKANVYGIVRSFRANPAESILLAVPMRSSKIEAVAVALAFADYAKRQSYWARDLIFLFIDGGDKVAAEAWFADYHGHRHPFIKPLGGDADDLHLELHGGQIIGAYVLDFSGTIFSHIDLQFSMVNGKLPNMDLLNLCVLLVEKAGTVTSIHGVPQNRGMDDEDYQKSAKTVIRGILAQSMNEVESLASVIGRYGINAVALSAYTAKNNDEEREQQHHSSTIVDLVDTVRLIEGAVRSLNNLLEKFHHSYLLYVLVSPHRFVSVAFYMPLMGLLLSPLLLLAVREWFRMGGAVQLASVSPALARMLFAPLVALSFYGLQLFLYADPRFPARTLAVPLTLLLPLFILGVFFLIPISSPLRANIHFARFALAVQLALFLGSLSLVHFPLALLLSSLLLPQAISTLIFDRKWFRLIAFFVFHPLSISLLLICNTSDFCNSPTKCWHRLSSRIIRIVSAHFFHDSWLLPIFSGPVFAICSAMNQIVFCDIEEKYNENIEQKEEAIEEKKKEE
ncbi:hypothetical protein niasHS_003566 [Heterodera schachtii]|uniref:Uncharacterized protein n=1 Tax=Heterodera schachtii TaxID=97005 RepID=A0ABD2KGU8_HETSC